MIFKSIFKDPSPPKSKFNESLSEFYLHQLNLFADKVIFVDYATKRQWTGSQVKSLATRLGRYMIDKLGIKRRDCCAILYKNNDLVQVLSVGIILAGASVCAYYPKDPAPEQAYALSIVKPKLVFVEAQLYQRMVELRQRLALDFKICIMDDLGTDAALNGVELAPNGPVVGFHRHMMNYEPSANGLRFPVPVEPDDPAYLLFTSGSTSKPKPVIRSHRNSLNVCCSLKTAPQLWDLSETSVLAGFQELDHGTGTFASKMTISNGLTNIVMDGYDMSQLINCIERHRVTDFCLGTGYLQNLMDFYCNKLAADARPDFASLKNIISIGSLLACHELKRQFMDLVPTVSVRQAFGMTECGFVAVQARDDARTDTSSVGYQLPTAELKICHPESRKELDGHECEGELWVRGPTVSPGYLWQAPSEEPRFNAAGDGFYRTNDVATIDRDGRLHIRGRLSEYLVFTDGWKVLPSEIEAKLLEHPQIKEAAVIGVPDPHLPTCHWPRAYVVLAERKSVENEDGHPGQLTEQQVYDFVAADMSDPKHLRGGVKFLPELPRISVGKVDKKALRAMDGY